VFPGRITNKTNGITPRRWLFEANRGLTTLMRETIGEEMLDNLNAISDLNKFAEDAAFQEKFAKVKRENKERLARVIHERMGLRFDPGAMVDVQVKRIHEYKRQLLNILEAVSVYNKIRSHPEKEWVPRVKIFGGKAAASYWQAKLIIRLINDVARVVNADPAVHGLLKIAFVPNYNVSLAEIIVPAADLSEQISTAGMEASGTGNMKFALNGALTIGTLDGANVEIRDHVGADNIVIFGLTAEEVAERRANGFNPREVIENSRDLSDVLDMIRSGVFSPGERDRYKGLIDILYNSDWFLVAADFTAYAKAQRQVDAIWANPAEWHAKAIRNTANMAWFSSDRTIRSYAEEIWNVPTM
jgi:starch phosphorylase